jgi:hypothetical protein
MSRLRGDQGGSRAPRVAVVLASNVRSKAASIALFFKFATSSPWCEAIERRQDSGINRHHRRRRWGMNAAGKGPIGRGIDVAALFVDDVDEEHFACGNDVSTLTRRLRQRGGDGAISVDVTDGVELLFATIPCLQSRSCSCSCSCAVAIARPFRSVLRRCPRQRSPAWDVRSAPLSEILAHRDALAKFPSSKRPLRTRSFFSHPPSSAERGPIPSSVPMPSRCSPASSGPAACPLVSSSAS